MIGSQTTTKYDARGLGLSTIEIFYSTPPKRGKILRGWPFLISKLMVEVEAAYCALRQEADAAYMIRQAPTIGFQAQQP